MSGLLFYFAVLLLHAVKFVFEFLLTADEYKCCIFFRDIFPASNHNDLFGHVECVQVCSVN